MVIGGVFFCFGVVVFLWWRSCFCGGGVFVYFLFCHGSTCLTLLKTYAKNINTTEVKKMPRIKKTAHNHMYTKASFI